MAQEWYLLKSPHVTVSGYETDSFNEFAPEGFGEALDSSLATDITIYNYDLTESKEAKAIVLDKVQDTKLKTLNRMVLVPIGTCHTSDIIKYRDRYWLVVGLVDNNGVYEKLVMVICNYQLTWMQHGDIFQRWCNITSASQYNNGETATNQLTVTSDQLLVLLPDDDESIMLRQGQRFIVDRRCKVYEKDFDDSVTVETKKYVSVYELTRSDSVLFDYQTEGFHQMMISKAEKGKADGYYVVDGKGYWLCGAPPSMQERPPHTLLTSELLYDTLEIQNGLEPAVFTAIFYDYKNEECTEKIPYTWEIDCDFKDKLIVERVENSVMISADDWKLSNKTFDLSLVAPDYYTKTVTVKIVPF